MRKSMLEPWIRGNDSITPKNFIDKNIPNLELGLFIGIDEYVELYKAYEFDSGNLTDSWNKTREYIENALKIIKYDEINIDFRLDKDERHLILTQLGEPPLCSYNIYIITVYNDIEEKIVYIGKTDSKNSRFLNGHLASLKLHNPIYDRYKKRVYFSTIMLLNESGEYLPLEYITSLNKAKELLSLIEIKLIDYFKPELNTQGINTDVTIHAPIHMQNFTNTSPFLNDIFI